MIDQAKHYYVFFDNRFHHLVFEYLLKTDCGFKLRNYSGFRYSFYIGKNRRTRVFCGKKKMRKLINELYLLGYDDAFIVEIKGGNNYGNL